MRESGITRNALDIIPERGAASAAFPLRFPAGNPNRKRRGFP